MYLCNNFAETELHYYIILAITDIRYEENPTCGTSCPPVIG